MDEQDVTPRLDLRGFQADMAAMRAELSRGLGDAAELGARTIETSLLRAVRTGRFGFDELKATALSALDAIARAALREGVGQVSGGQGLLGLLGGLVSGLPGRATGGPVAPDRPYWVGERGPELFVPTTSGRIEVPGSGRAGRDVRVAITIHATAGETGAVLQRSSRQVARAVRAALAED
jgi:hypothetical protein